MVRVLGGATYIPLHVVITDQTLSFFTQNTDMPKDWKVTLTTDLLWKKYTHIADHSPGANKDTQITNLKSHNNLSGPGGGGGGSHWQMVYGDAQKFWGAFS